MRGDIYLVIVEQGRDLIGGYVFGSDRDKIILREGTL